MVRRDRPTDGARAPLPSHRLRSGLDDRCHRHSRSAGSPQEPTAGLTERSRPSGPGAPGGVGEAGSELLEAAAVLWLLERLLGLIGELAALWAACKLDEALLHGWHPLSPLPSANRAVTGRRSLPPFAGGRTGLVAVLTVDRCAGYSPSRAKLPGGGSKSDKATRMSLAGGQGRRPQGKRIRPSNARRAVSAARAGTADRHRFAWSRVVGPGAYDWRGS